MLTDKEKYCLSHFLGTVDDIKLKNLASSVTMGRINNFNSREDAISTILLHTESLSSFFNRKKVSSAVLFNYIHHLKQSIPGEAPKEILLQRIFDVWQLPYTPVAQQFQQSISYNSPVQNQISTVNQRFLQTSSENSLKEMVTSKKLLKEAYVVAYDEFILQFAKTYYDLLNEPAPNGIYLHRLDTSHFFNDCKLFINIIGNEEIEESGENVETVLKMLSDLKQNHQLVFHPNLSEDGVRGKTDSHGLIFAVICGTLYQARNLVGVFEQSFILRRDPYSQNSCKIVETTLNLKSSNAVSSFTQLMLAPGRSISHLAVNSAPSKLAIEDISSNQLHN